MRTVLLVLFAIVVSAPGLTWAQEDPLKLGSFEHGINSNGLVVTAPHPYDPGTDRAVWRIVELYAGTGFVIASGFMVRERININRPTEGAGSCRGTITEQITPRAAVVYQEFRRQVELAGAGSLKLLVEIHVNNEPRTSGNIEVATKGIDAATARGLKDRYQQSFLEASQAALAPTRLRLLVEPVDTLYWGASCNKMLGIMKEYARVLHLEAPVAALGPGQWETYSTVYARLLKWMMEGK